MRTLLPLVLPLSLAGACTAAPISADNPLTLLVGPAGGSVQADGIQIDVPAGAVDSEVTITAFPKTRAIDGLTTASSTWSFGPEGQTFNTPISVSLAYAGEATHPTVWWTKEGDLKTFTNLQTTAADGWAKAAVAHFSEGAVADETCGGGSSDGEEADDEEDDDGGDVDSGDGDGEEADDGDVTDTGDGDGEEADDGDCVDGIDSVTGEECDGGPAANQDDGEEADDDGDESGGDCVDGIDSVTGEECDGGPSANQDDGEGADDEGDEEEHGACEHHDEGDEANDEGGGEDTDDVEE